MKRDRSRVYDPEHKMYVAFRNQWTYQWRGLPVHEKFRDFPTFLATVGEPPSQDHILIRPDTSRNLAPDNFQWVDRKGFCAHCKPRATKTIEVNGVPMTIAQIAERVGVSKSAIYSRVARGHDPLTRQQFKKPAKLRYSESDIDFTRLKPAHAAIIRARLDGKKLQEIADEYGVSRQRICQIEKDVLNGKYRRESAWDSRYVGEKQTEVVGHGEEETEAEYYL